MPRWATTAWAPRSFGILVTGVLLAVVGAIVAATGTRWIDVLMPPVVTGAIVALIGFNLGGAATSNYRAGRRGSRR